MRGPPLFTRIETIPSLPAASSHFFATSIPALRAASSSEAMFVGALFERC
jgi:hypothetical protein